MELAAKKVQELTASGYPVEIICESIADAKALTAFLKKSFPDLPIYTRIHSFEPFSKGCRKDPIRCGDVIVTTAISGRGTDFHLDTEAEQKKLCLIKLGVYKHERADRQVDGRTARKGLAGRLIHILCPQHGESSLEEMHARRDLHQEQALDRIRKEDLHQNRINRQLFEDFSKLSREVEKIIRETESGKWSWVEGFVERQMAALRTHWALWLDEAEQKMEETGIRDADALYADFQVFRKKMLAMAKEEGQVKFVKGAGDLTRLGIWFALEKNDSSMAMACFDRVIQDFYPFSGQALYYKAFVILNSDKHFRARKKAAYYLKQAKVLLKKEIQRLQETVDRMVAIDNVVRKEGQGLQDSQFKKTVNGIVHSFMVHLSAIDFLIGSVTDPSFFQSVTDDREEAEALFKDLIAEGDIKGYRINKKVFVTENKRLEVVLANGKRQEIKFPAELSDYREKIINMIFVRQGGDLKLSTLSYEQYCRLVFDEKEDTAEEKKKMAMKLSWQFLQQENVISQPSLARSRWRKMSLDKDEHSCKFSESAWVSAGGLLRILDEIEMHTDSIQNLSQRGKIPMEVFSFFKHSLEFDQVIRVEKKPVRWNLDATFVLFLSGLQLMAGIFLACPALIHQGIGDMVFVAMSAIRGDFSLENYLRYKRIAVATAALTTALKPVVNWVIKSVDKVVQNTAEALERARENVNSSLPKAFISGTVDVMQKGSSYLSFTQKMVNAVHTPELVRHTDTPMPFLMKFGSALKQASSEIATQATMEYLTTTFCPDDLERNVRKTLGGKLQIQINEIAKEIKKICMKILEYSESPEQGEKIVQFLFETTLREHVQKRQNPMNINISLFSTEEMGDVFAYQVHAWTGKGFLAGLTGCAIANLDKVGAISQAVSGAKSFMEEVKKNVVNKRDKLQSTKKRNKRTEKESADFAKFLDEEIQKLKNKIGNESLSSLGNTVLKPVVSCTWNKAIDFVSKGAKKVFVSKGAKKAKVEKVDQGDESNENNEAENANVEKVDQGYESNENKNSASLQILGENTQFPKTLSEVWIVEQYIGGMTGAMVVEDRKGNRYVIKTAKNREHLLSEYATNRAYAALGIHVPEAVLYDQATGKQITGNEQIYSPIMLSKYVERSHKLGFVLKECGRIINENQVKDIIKQGFVADCLLANTDVGGLLFDNILIDMENKIAWRVDCGAALDHEAMGEKKALTAVILEFETFLNPKKGFNTASLFETLTDEDIVNQIDAILDRRKSFLAAIPHHLKDTMEGRLNYLSVYRAKLTCPNLHNRDVEAFFKRPCYEDLHDVYENVTYLRGINFLKIMFGEKRAKEFAKYYENTCSLRLSYYLNGAGAELPQGRGAVSYDGKDGKKQYAYPRLYDLVDVIEKNFDTKFIEITEESLVFYGDVQGIAISFLDPEDKLDFTGHGKLGSGRTATVFEGRTILMPFPTKEMRAEYEKLKVTKHKKQYHLFCESVKKQFFPKEKDQQEKSPQLRKNALPPEIEHLRNSLNSFDCIGG